MTDDGRAFRLLRAEKSDDSTQWLPSDCVAKFVGGMESGEIKPTKLLILYTEDSEDGTKEYHRWFAANLTNAEMHFLLDTRKWLDLRNRTEGRED